MKRHHRKIQLFLGLTLFLLSATFALDVPPLQAPVTDRANLFSKSELQELNTYLYAIHEKSDVQVAVLTVPSLEGDSIEDYSIRVAEAWQIGKKGKDSGVIVVIAAADRKVRIEVGYGLEDTLTDAKTNKIIRSVIVPAFEKKEYAQGTLLGIKSIAAEILHGENSEGNLEEGMQEDEDDLPLPALILLIVIFLAGSRFMPGGWFWPLFLLSSTRRGGFSGGFGGGSNRSDRGGGFSGGGGKFGGGGSSGSW